MDNGRTKPSERVSPANHACLCRASSPFAIEGAPVSARGRSGASSPMLLPLDRSTHPGFAELERLVIEAADAVQSSDRFRALSSLVAIPPLVSHLMDSCAEMCSPVGETEIPGPASGREGYL